jgi:hypothetical protein
MLNLLSIFFCSAVTRPRLRRSEREARISAWLSARTRAGLALVRGVKTVLPKPGDAGVTGIVACDGNDGVLAALPMPLGSYTVGLLAGPAGMPEIDELPAPAEPAGGVSCARDGTDEKKIRRPRVRTAALRTIEISFRGDRSI